MNHNEADAFYTVATEITALAERAMSFVPEART